MLSEIAITPNVFFTKSYPSEEYGRLCLRSIVECLRNEAIVRDVGQVWRSFLSTRLADFHPLGRELFEYLIKRGRIIDDGIVGGIDDMSDSEWLNLALESHRKSSLDVIVTRVKTPMVPGFLAVDISSLDSSPWWQRKSESIQVHSSRLSYMRVLDKIARSARKIMFIDPYLNLGMREFREMLGEVLNINPNIYLEIHTSERAERPEEYLDGYISKINWRGRATIHVWRKFHHRYIISNIVGLQIPVGIDFVRRDEPTPWTRLSQQDRENIEMHFNPISKRSQHLRQFNLR